MIKEKEPFEKGRELEEKIERYFRLHGYQTKRNVILEGKSGGKHEIDILAEKSDIVTTVKIMVECKAWDKPIEKDVVSKVGYVLQDLGLNKAIIVSLKGWRTGAEKAAKELGIELWGKDEIENKLGKVALAELETIEFKRVSVEFSAKINETQAISLIEKCTKGFLKLGKKEVKECKLVWIPFYLFEISHSKSEGLIFRKLVTKKIWNLYEALEGQWFLTFEEEPKLEDIKITYFLQPQIKDTKIKKAILETFKKLSEVVTPKAVLRYATQLKRLGIALPVAGISFDEVSEVYYPFYLGFLRKGDKERVLAIDGVKGEVNEIMSEVLTRNLSYVRTSIKK
jgi:hypothetical protein